MSGHNQIKEVEVVELVGMSIPDQAEQIADEFSNVSNQYNELKTDDIDIKQAKNTKEVPIFQPEQINQKILKMKNKTTTVSGDIPMKLIKLCSEKLSYVLSDVYNSATIQGKYPNIWKLEIVYPTKTVNDLRKISGTKKFSLIFESTSLSFN